MYFGVTLPTLLTRLSSSRAIDPLGSSCGQRWSKPTLRTKGAPAGDRHKSLLPACSMASLKTQNAPRVTTPGIGRRPSPIAPRPVHTPRASPLATTMAAAAAPLLEIKPEFGYVVATAVASFFIHHGVMATGVMKARKQ